MTTPETTAEWARKEPQRSFIECAERLQDQDHSISAMADATLMISLTMQNEIHGPQWLAARLVMLADKYHAEADQIRRAGAEARDGLPN
jgi:hypothetical protein